MPIRVGQAPKRRELQSVKKNADKVDTTVALPFLTGRNSGRTLDHLSIVYSGLDRISPKTKEDRPSSCASGQAGHTHTQPKTVIFL